MDERLSVRGLTAIVRRPAYPATAAAVMIDGSGPSAADDEWPAWAAGVDAVLLRHDKPGDWREQSLQDRAEESLAALGTLRSRLAPGTPVGLIGHSQGGWVAVLAAAIEPDEVGFVVTLSGPGVP